MVSDANKGITSISYNHLDLPTQVTFASGNIQYTYSADGTKLKKTVSTTGTETLYAGGFMYEGNTLQFFSHPEGYVTPNTSGGYDYIYQFRDHVDNVRLSYTDADGNGSIDPSNEIIKESNFYPFGLSHKGYNNNVSSLGNSVAKRFMFGGKELDESLGLDTYDFGARNYNPDLGRWMNLDPLAEQMRRHGPYNYAFNSPIFFMDPDGMKPCPTGDCNTILAGMIERANQFNSDLAQRGNNFLNNPVKSINKGFADAGGFLADVTNISGIRGEENQLYNTIGAGAEKLSNFSSLSQKEKGSLLMGGIIFAGEIALTKKPSSSRGLSKLNSSKTPLLLTDGGSVPNAGGKITSFTTKETSTFFRVSDNGGQGGFLTRTKPSSSSFAQEALALPPGNTASLIQKVTVPGGIQLQRSRALPAFGKRGGAEQFQILNYNDRSLIDFGPAKPFKLDSSF